MGPLAGVRIVEFAGIGPGPFCGMLLADLGADVLLVERKVPNANTAGVSFFNLGRFAIHHRGKRAIALDLKKPEGTAVALRLIERADALIEGFRPGVMERMGLGPEACAARNPRLVYGRMTGWGQTGTLSHAAGHDLNYLARSGVLGAQGPSDRPPQVPGFQLADVSGGMWSVIAIQAALMERARTGQGAVIDIAMTDGVLGFAVTAMASALAGEAHSRGTEPLTGGIAPYNTYTSSDGHPITLAA